MDSILDFCASYDAYRLLYGFKSNGKVSFNVFTFAFSPGLRSFLAHLQDPYVIFIPIFLSRLIIVCIITVKLSFLFSFFAHEMVYSIFVFLFWPFTLPIHTDNNNSSDEDSSFEAIDSKFETSPCTDKERASSQRPHRIDRTVHNIPDKIITLFYYKLLYLAKI